MKTLEGLKIQVVFSVNFCLFYRNRFMVSSTERERGEGGGKELEYVVVKRDGWIGGWLDR